MGAHAAEATPSVYWLPFGRFFVARDGIQLLELSLTYYNQSEAMIVFAKADTSYFFIIVNDVDLLTINFYQLTSLKNSYISGKRNIKE